MLKDGNSMKKRSLLAILPFVLVLSSCGATRANINTFIESTNAHEEIFGSLSNVDLKPRKLDSNQSLTNLYKPVIGYQRKNDDNSNSFSVRFVAALQSETDRAVWTRSVHNLSGTLAKEKSTKAVSTVYSTLNSGGLPSSDPSQIVAEDGSTPYNCFAVYCLLNIPNSYSDYYVDAFLTVYEGENEASSNVGSINIANPDKHITYSLGNNPRCLAFVNGVSKESGNLDGDKVAVLNAELKAGDKIQVFYVNPSNFTYSLCGNQSLGRSCPEFTLNNGDELNVNINGKYNIYLNGSDQYYFEKEIFLEGKYGWGENEVSVELTDGNNYTGPRQMSFVESINELPVYTSFVNLGYNKVQFANETLHFYSLFEIDFPANENNYYKYSTNRWSVFGGTDDSGFSITDFIDSVEIHTQEQKDYLSLNKNYDQLSTSEYPDGTIHKSDPLPVNISFDYTVPSGKTLKNYSVIYGKEPDLSDGYSCTDSENPTSKSIDVYNSYLGRNYYRLVATFIDGTEDYSSIHTYDVDSTCPRNIKIAGLTNCRDLGGRLLEDGGHIKQGLIYRTSGDNYRNANATDDLILPEGRTEMLEHLKVKTEINVSDGTGNNVNLSGITVKNFSMSYSNGRHHFSRNAESVRDFFEAVADSNNYPIFFHCRIGTDRTGLCAILLNGLLGVPLNDIYQDYLFSNFGNIEKRRYIGTEAGNDNIENYIADINSLPGTTFKNRVYNALLSIGLSRTTLDTVIANLTDGTLAEGNDAGQVIAPATSLSHTDGLNITHQTSNAKVPEYYYTLSKNSQSVSYSFEANEAYRGQVVAYLGSSSTTTCSANLNTVLSCKLDSTSMTVNSVICSNVGLYSNSSGSTVHYFFVVLGEIDIPRGSRTITITGTSKSINIGGIYIFNTQA